MPTGNLKTERKTGNLLPSPFKFKKYGQSGIEVSEIFSETRRMHRRPVRDPLDAHGAAESRALAVHAELRATDLPGRPSMGSWLTYGLGTENQNLPGLHRAVSRACR